MVRIFASSALALALALVANALPGAYEISRGENALAVSDSVSWVVNAQAGGESAPFKRWTLEPTCSSHNKFYLKNEKFGTYLQYRADVGMMYDEKSPVEFELVPSYKPDTYYVKTKEGLYMELENGVGISFPIEQAPPIVVKPENKRNGPWTFKRV